MENPTTSFPKNEPLKSSDPFTLVHSDLTVPLRLLRITKSGVRVPVTLRFIRERTDVSLVLAIPPLHSQTTYLYGIEYDDASRGKHEGVYEGESLFECRQKGLGAGAFLLGLKDLRRGYTFAEALGERYDVDIPGISRVGGNEIRESESNARELKLGSSGIIVEAPGIDEVQKRLKQIGRLQSIGLEGYDISGLGGDENTKTFLRNNLTSLYTLDISNNLLISWEEVAEIIACIPSLNKIIINNCRIERLTRALHIKPPTTEFIRQSFKNIQELEFCNSYASWDDVMLIGPFLPHLERLDLVDNSILTTLKPMKTTNGVPLFLELKYLNLSGCRISDWLDLAEGLRLLPKLETLDISHTPLNLITPLPTETPPIHLQNLILLSSNISNWASIDALNQWTSNTLTSLKYTSSPSSLIEDPSNPSLRISGDQATDRSILIAKLPSLIMLNSTPVHSTERRDAEVGYVKMIDTLIGSKKGKKEDWGRYEELKKVHGVVDVSSGVVNLRVGHLRSRLYNLTIFTIIPDIGSYGQTAEITILPSAQMALLRKKVYRTLGVQVGQEIKIWTVSEKFSDEERGKATEVPDGETVGWWFADGDEFIAEVV